MRVRVKVATDFSNKGFTLIEVMIVVAIVAILAAIGLPSYKSYIARGNRADAKAVLLENVQRLERQFTATNSYITGLSGTPLAPPIATAPQSGTTNYNISFSGTPDATSFTLQAVPTGGMTGDSCGTLTITHTGTKGNSGGTLSATECWAR